MEMDVGKKYIRYKCSQPKQKITLVNEHNLMVLDDMPGCSPTPIKQINLGGYVDILRDQRLANKD